MFFQQQQQQQQHSDQRSDGVINPGLIGLSPFHYIPTGPSVLPPLTAKDMFLTGFTDCAQEAIRYLVEVEGLPSHDPMVLGLKQHLYEQQRIYELNLLLRNSFQLNTYNSEHDLCSEVNKVKQNTCENVMNSGLVSHESVEDSVNKSRHENPVDECNINNSASIHEQEQRNDSEQIKHMHIDSSETDVPNKVAELVNELFSLLQEEENDMYLDSDSEVDEGFEELDLVDQEVAID